MIMSSLTRNGRALKCLLLGYNGVGNTGSDIRLLTAIDDVRDAFGTGTEFTVATLDRARTEAILPAASGIMVTEVSFSPHRFMVAVWRLCKQHDVTLLVEGSTYKQNWSVWLLHAYHWASQCARWHGNYAVAYAVDVGELFGIHALRTRFECERTALVITRTEIARQRLRDLGVRRSIIANTDTAFRYACPAKLRTGNRRVVGLAPIEFFHWPVQLKFWCRPEDRHRGLFAFTWNAERREQSAAMVERWVGLARHAIEHHDLDVQLIAMEMLDTPVCEKIRAQLDPKMASRVSLASSDDVPPAEMVAMLRGLDALVTSRYHACVLSMAGAVPQMAINHDERLASIYAEIGVDQDYLLHYRQPDLSEKLIPTFDRMMQNSRVLAERIRDQHDNRFIPACLKNHLDLRNWGLQVFGSPAQTAKTARS